MNIRTTSAAVVLSSALAVALNAQKVAEIEPNDTAATAMAITAGQHIVASYATAADEDWFSFTLANPGQVHVHTVATGTLSLSTSRDNRIAIYDATGTNRLAWNDGAVGSMADCGVTLPAGTYTARVGLKSGTAGSYDLDFYVLPAAPVMFGEFPEPNGASSSNPSMFTVGQSFGGNLTLGDEDYWMFSLAGRGIVVAASYDDGGAPQLDNMALRIHSGLPGGWLALGASDATNSASHRVTTLAHPGMLSAGTYAISVKGGTAAAGTAPWDFTKTGEYAIRTALIDMPGLTTVVEGAEPNDNISTPAGTFTLGEDLQGFSTGSTGDGIDWYRFTVFGPTTIGAMAEGLSTSPTPLAGSTIRLWDSTGTVNMASGSGSATTHGRLVFTIERAGTYYLQIAGATATVAGDYVLHTGGTNPLYYSASTRMEPASTNACIGTNGQRPLFGNLSGETPAFDSTFVTRLDRALPSSFAIYVLSVTPLPPVSLGLGGLDSQSNPTDCALRVMPDVLFLGLTDAAGSGELVLTFPYNPMDIGLKIYQQAVCYDPTLNGFGFSVSNDASYMLGDRPF